MTFPDAGPEDDPPLAADVLGDWGTSRLRLWRLEDGVVAETREGPGTAALAGLSVGARIEALASLVATWAEGREPLRVLLAGMAGSRNGLFEVPYAPLPADCAGWARAARSLALGNLRVTIAAGIARPGGATPPDVMRGEETQLFGALEIEPALARGAHVAVLPGTHSKWIEIADGSIRRFRTVMTGELYALLGEHSTLLRAGSGKDEAAARDGSRDAGFDAGVARSAADAFLATLFETRAAQLLEDRSPAWAAGFLSGLLIGREIGELSRSFDTSAGVTLIGDPGLLPLYARVFTRGGIDARALDGAACTIAGLRRLCARPGAA